jgi:hypothetical protein
MGGVSNKTTSHTYYPGFGFDVLFKVTDVKVKKISIFLWHSGVGWGRCPINFGCDPILNMAPGILLRFRIPGCNYRMGSPDLFHISVA